MNTGKYGVLNPEFTPGAGTEAALEELAANHGLSIESFEWKDWPGGLIVRIKIGEFYYNVDCIDESRANESFVGIKAAVLKRSATIGATLDQRGKTHGDFGNNATVALQIRDVMRSMKPHWHNLSAEQRLALEEIALKIGRICSGGHKETEHWHDIQGYAKLGERCAASLNEVQK